MKTFVRHFQTLLNQMGNGLSAQHLGEMKPRKQKSAELNPVCQAQQIESTVAVVEESSHDAEALPASEQVAALSAV